jgi:hypothetical protein
MQVSRFNGTTIILTAGHHHLGRTCPYLPDMKSEKPSGQYIGLFVMSN